MDLFGNEERFRLERASFYPDMNNISASSKRFIIEVKAIAKESGKCGKGELE